MDFADLNMMSEDIEIPCYMYSELKEPRTIREAWDHPDPLQ